MKTERSPLHVVFICAEFPYQEQATGGFGAYVERLAEALVKLKQRVTVICQGSKAVSLTKAGVTVIVVKSLIHQNDNTNLMHRFLAFINYPLYFSWQAARILRKKEHESKIDIVEGGDFGAEVLFYLLGPRRTKVVIKLHTPSFVIRKYNEEPLSISYAVLEFFERICLFRADSLYSPTRVLALIVKERLGIPVNAIIPYPVPLKSIHSSRQTKDLILYVGKLQRKKGVYVLLDAIREVTIKYPEVKYYFIGPDTRENGVSVRLQLEQLVNKYGLGNIKFLPPIPQSELTNWYRRSITVVPSLWENFPNVLFEATMNGSAIIASRVGGIPEMVEDRRQALLVPPYKPKLLANAIITLIKNKTLRIRLVQRAKRRFLRDYSPSQIADQTLTFYEHVLTGTREG